MAGRGTSPRPFKTDYGLWQGHCKTRENALIAAFRRVVLLRYTHVTVEDEDGNVIARLRRTAAGVHIEAPDSRPGIDPMTLKLVRRAK